MGNVRVSLLSLALLALPGMGLAQESQPNASALAKELAPKIRDYVIAKQGTNKYDVAVFAFGNLEGASPPSFGISGKVLQGEIIYELNRLASSDSGDRFNVLTLANITRRLKNTPEADINALAEGDVAHIQEVMEQGEFEIAIVGSIDAINYLNVVQSGQPHVPVTAKAFAIDGSSKTLTGRLDNGDIGQLSGVGSESTHSPFEVNIWVKGTKRQLVRGKENTIWQRVYFLELQESDRHGECQIEIVNMPNASDGDDPAREWGVAALVDGVNTIFQRNGKRAVDGSEEIGPVIRHPNNCAKWAISPPRHYYDHGVLKPTPSQYLGSEKWDHSRRMLRGFQTETGDEGTGKTFLLADKGGSIATSLGIRNDVGILELHFYPRKKEGEEPGDPLIMAGGLRTKTVAMTEFSAHAPSPNQPGEPGEITAGDEFNNATQDVHIPLTGVGEVMRIHYYYPSAPPEENGVPIIPADD